jgi:ring-1,2-phenylacetyl-CoA epoxidase subunit PaaD
VSDRTGAKQPTAGDYAIWKLLESVTDPEIPVVNLREMGILRAVHQTEAGLEVVITPTYSGCPAMSQMEDDVAGRARQSAVLLLGVLTRTGTGMVHRLDDPRGPREKLRAYGIAPPHPSACVAQPAHTCGIQFATQKDGRAKRSRQWLARSAAHTTQLRFRTSAQPHARPLYRCLNCMEPFDYFKPY